MFSESEVAIKIRAWLERAYVHTGGPPCVPGITGGWRFTRSIGLLLEALQHSVLSTFDSGK